MSYAAWQAAEAVANHPGLVQTCGLVTHGLFEANAFANCLGEVTPCFNPAQGVGLGFDELFCRRSFHFHHRQQPIIDKVFQKIEIVVYVSPNLVHLQVQIQKDVYSSMPKKCWSLVWFQNNKLCRGH